MLPTAYVDARTMKLLFLQVFSCGPIFAGRDTAEKVPTEQMFLCKTVVFQETYLYRRDAVWLAAFDLLV